MEEEPNSDTLEGTTEPTVVDAGRVFVNTGPEFPVQKNQAAKVIGILVIIWGAFNLLGSPLTLLSDFGATDLQGNPISYPTEYFVVTMLSSVIAGAIAIFGWYQMIQYKKMGIWMIFGSFAIAWIGSIISSTIAGVGYGYCRYRRSWCRNGRRIWNLRYILLCHLWNNCGNPADVI